MKKLFCFLVIFAVLWTGAQARAARIWSDSFEGAGYQMSYTPSGTVDPDDAAPAPHATGGSESVEFVANVGNSYHSNIIADLASEHAITYVEKWIYIDSEGLADNDAKFIIQARDSSSAQVYKVEIRQSAGVLKFAIKVWNNGALSIYYQSDVVSIGQWYRIEVKYDYTNSDFAYRLYDATGSELWNSSLTLTGGLKTGVQYFHVGAFAGVTKDLTVHIDSLAVNTDGWIGARRLYKQTLTPDADVTATWTKAGGTNNYEILNDSNDATYLTESNTGSIERVDFSTPALMGAPVGVRTWFRMQWLSGPIGFGQGSKLVNLGINTAGNTVDSEVGYVPQEFRNFYVEHTQNPETASAWDWADFTNLQSYMKTAATADGGGVNSEQWIEVVQATDPANCYVLDGPMFGGVDADTIKVWVRLSGACAATIRYNTDEATLKTGTGTETAAQIASVSDDYCLTFTINSLDADTVYFFDVIVNDADSMYNYETSGTNVNPYWTALPTAKTFPAEDIDTDYAFTFGGDIHDHREDWDVWQTIASHDTDFFIDLGDQYTANSDDRAVMKTAAEQIRGNQFFSAFLQANILSKKPIVQIHSDHELVEDDCHKIGYGDYDGSIVYEKMYAALDFWRDWVPIYSSLAPDDITGTGDAGGDADTLIDVGADLSEVRPGMVLHQTTDGQYAIVQSVNDTTDTIETSVLSGAATWASKDYRVGMWGHWFSFKHGNTEFFGIDMRAKRDPNFSPGCDALDGTSYGTLPKDSGTAEADTNTTTIKDVGAFSNTVVGDVVFNATRSLQALVATVPDANSVTLQTAITGQTTGDTFSVYESGGSDHGSKAANETAGHIQREWLIDAVNNSTARYKIILSESSFKHDHNHGQDAWGGIDPLDAQLSYIRDNITAVDVVVLAANDHFIAMDDGNHPDDPWPSYIVGALHFDPSVLHTTPGVFTLDGLASVLAFDSGLNGGYGVATVTTDNFAAVIYDENGNILNSGSTNFSHIIPRPRGGIQNINITGGTIATR